MTFDFTPITIDGQAAYRLFLEKTPQVTSDYSFINLWSWAIEYGLQWAFSDHLVWIRQTKPKPVLWAPVGDWRAVDWKAVFTAGSGVGDGFVRVPETLAGIWTETFGKEIVAAPDRNQWDYIYSADDLKSLSGNRFHKKKNLVNQFIRKYSHTYSSLTRDHLDRVRELQTHWCTWRDCESSDMLAAENQAIERTLAEWDRLTGICGGIVFVENAIAAYTIGEHLGPDMLLIHYEKGNPEFKGVYQAVNQFFVMDQARAGQRVNREQDLGDEGLRKAKESYQPVGYLKKFRVPGGTGTAPGQLP